MIPIFEQGTGKSIGYNLDGFLSRFEDICRNKSGQSFALIIYDFEDEDLKAILKSEGVFVRLDRLSGDALHIFYLHTGSRKAAKRFNANAMEALGLRAGVPPCVIFFRLADEGFTDIEVVSLDSANLILGFHELYSVIEEYMHRQPVTTKKLRYLSWIPGAVKFVSAEALKAGLKESFNHLHF